MGGSRFAAQLKSTTCNFSTSFANLPACCLPVCPCTYVCPKRDEEKNKFQTEKKLKDEPFSSLESATDVQNSGGIVRTPFHMVTFSQSYDKMPLGNSVLEAKLNFLLFGRKILTFSRVLVVCSERVTIKVIYGGIAWRPGD